MDDNQESQSYDPIIITREFPEEYMDDQMPMARKGPGATREHDIAGVESRRHWLWIGLIAAVTIASSLVFACATPLAALATVPAVTDRRGALRLVAVAWLANQVVGYAVLGYPRTFESYAWGVALGAGALVALGGARLIAGALSASAGLVRVAIAFAGAFIVYESALFATALVLGTGTAAFSSPIVFRIFEINVVALVALLALHWLGTLAGVARPRRMAVRPAMM